MFYYKLGSCVFPHCIKRRRFWVIKVHFSNRSYNGTMYSKMTKRVSSWRSKHNLSSEHIQRRNNIQSMRVFIASRKDLLTVAQNEGWLFQCVMVNFCFFGWKCWMKKCVKICFFQPRPIYQGKKLSSFSSSGNLIFFINKSKILLVFSDRNKG